jgi:hypothetical protein
MDPTEVHGDAGVANDVSIPSPTTTEPSAPTSDTVDNGVAGGATLTALADELEYTLTVGQALERIVAAGRAAPSGRSIQRYCIEGRLAAKKIRTIFGSEWLINETSLAQFIASEPIVTGDASVATSTDTAATATPTVTPSTSPAPATSDNGDASVATHTPMASSVGEKRTIAEVLIENARLLAQVEGRDAIIDELKEDRTFLREEVREGRRSRDDVKTIAEHMLDTLKTIAVGRLSMPTSSPHDPVEATIIDPEGRPR